MRSASEKAGGPAKAEGSSALLLSALCLFSTVFNRMAFRFVLVPMGRLTHLLSCTTNFVYILFFAAVVRYRLRSGSVNKNNWEFTFNGNGKWLMAGAGLAECTAFTLMPLFARNLPGSMLAVLSQSMIPFSMMFSIIAFQRSYSNLQYFGVAVVMLGIAVCSYPKAIADSALAGVGGAGLGKFVFNSVGLLLSYSFIAGSFVFKEKCFRRFTEEKGEGETLDGNVVNLTAAIWQCGALWVLWPFNFKFITPMSPVEYFSAASTVFSSPSLSGVVALYWIANIYYLGTSLTLVSKLNSVIALLVGAVAVPISALLFCLNWPVLGAETFSGYTVAGLLVIFGGLLIFNHKALGR